MANAAAETPTMMQTHILVSDQGFLPDGPIVAPVFWKDILVPEVTRVSSAPSTETLSAPPMEATSTVSF